MPRPNPRSSPSPPRSVPAQRLWPAVLVTVAALYVLSYLAIAVTRMSYPFELEWIEGGSLQATMRVLDGLPLYARPTLDYVAFNYPPLYPWVTALASKLVGSGFFPLRLTSFIASLGAFALAGTLVWRETRRALPVALAVGFMAASYRIGGAWFDVARADSLYLLLLLAAFTALRLDGSRTRSPLLAGILFSLAFLAKQSAVMVVFPVVLHLAWTARARCGVLVATLAAGIGGVTLVLDRIHQGWYRYFLFAAPLKRAMDPGRLAAFWPRDMLLPLGLALAIAAAYFARPGRSEAAPAARTTATSTPAPPRASGRGFYAAMFAGASLSSWFHRSYPGGYDNVLIPAYATVAILSGLGIHASLLWIQDAGTRMPGRIATALYVAITLQFVALVYDPWAQIPTAADRDAGDRFVERLRTIPGRVLIPSHPYLVRMAGKPDHFHEMALIGVLETATGETERRLRREFEQSVLDTSYSIVVLSTRSWLGTTIRMAYDPALHAFPDSTVFWPVTGMRTRPEYVWVPRREHRVDPASR